MAPETPDNIAAVIMAAGDGSRFGDRPKGLLERDGQPLVARQIDLLARAGLRRIVVVLGQHAAACEPILRQAQARLPAHIQLEWVRNPAPEGGTGASLRCALARIEAQAAVLVLLADQPLLQGEDIDAALCAWAARAPGSKLVVPTHQGQFGHPLIFGPALRRWLTRQPASVGVRDWRRAHPAQVQAVPVTHPRCTLNIDTEADLAALATIHGIHLRWPVLLSEFAPS
ncbi:MAG: nucleotidyltransferase family protein [Betaproteobacteria bacterium]|nr:nucleotidyltransferase family protein [Betaproteobacteria bacterium]